MKSKLAGSIGNATKMEKLPTIDIKGKEYVMVKDRIIFFNENFKEGSIVTEILKNDEYSVVIKATVYPSKKEERSFVGHSEAYRGEGMMGAVPIEVAETSAVGRALAMLGIGVIESVASADEIVKPVYNTSKLNPMQNSTKPSAFKKASDKQKNFINKLRAERGEQPMGKQFEADLDMNTASEEINRLNTPINQDHFEANDMVDYGDPRE